MATKIIVLLADDGDPRRGEISVLDSTTEAERFVESLLEAGFDEENIRVFASEAMNARVTHRPVVALVAEETHGSSAPDPSPATVEVGHEEPAPSGAGTERDNGTKVWSSLFGGASLESAEAMPELLH